jgi:carbon-monoxide dehydrogenase medium subunit
MEFTYLEPQTLHEAIDLLAEHNGSGKLIANGTDLINQMRLHVRAPDVVIDLGYIPGLDDIVIQDNGDLILGAMATGGQIERNQYVRNNFPVIARCAEHLGSKAIRNRATIGGNLCNASPAADSPPGLLVHDAIVNVVGAEGERSVPVASFFTGPGQTILSEEEILASVTIPRAPEGSVGYFMKHSIKGTSDLSFANVAALFTVEEGVFSDARLALGAVGPTPIRARSAEAVLIGNPVNKDTIARAGTMSAEECNPIDDLRCSADYRRELVEVYVRNVIDIALGRRAPNGVTVPFGDMP